MAPLDLTFGVELELICIWPEGCFDNTTPVHEVYDERNAGAVLYDELLKAGVPATGHEPDALRIHPSNPYDRWTVQEDYVKVSEAETEAIPEHWHWPPESIEICSPIFKLTDNWQDQIRAVLNALARVESYGCRFLTNHSTGLHVHVGCGAGNRIPLRTSKNLLQLATAFERCTDEIHAANRIAWPAEWQEGDDFDGGPAGVWHIPPSWWFHNNGSCDNHDILFKWLSIIERTQSYEHLSAISRVDDSKPRSKYLRNKRTCGHNSAYNFENLYPKSSWQQTCKGTIEFRQHAGTTDFLEIIHWIALTTRMVSYCHDVQPADFLTVLAHGVDPSFGLRDFLSTIGCPAETISHFMQDDNALIGMLTQDQALPVVKLEDFEDLIAANDQEQTSRADPVLKSIVMAQKSYGIHPEYINIISIPIEAVEWYYEDAESETLAKGFITEPELVDSFARVMVLERLGDIYDGENVERERAEAQHGPVVVFEHLAVGVEGEKDDGSEEDEEIGFMDLV
ncbi:hypothetical protein BAUCODRAFT_125086 [Baudoinia panamericana UAMH 10762]|uniref:Amidoligase enzyme n=1 Tax=Baudoinia panamericana (strain UAMH 10762) TaxID=717646 RepID=M2M9T4_BAUPA|nr:uncharacterized protein BAUCODRAFT_125086 [Baudoinia panamericana UAMH 10762]EMC93206.1 hypothetical protein BAUCODRAFT_125086 [Baudoinia panamericana UAMH 10762]